MKRETLLVTIAVGDNYIANWRTYCANGWHQYADKHGFDVMCIDRPLDESARAQQRSVAWQKCLILGQQFAQKYERVVWIDSDILINPGLTPSVVANVPVERVGAVRAYSTPTRDLFLEAHDRMVQFYEANGIKVVRERTPLDYHRNFDLPPTEYDDVVQSGVLVLSPLHHREVLEKVYYQYEDKGHPQWHYEMRPLSHELQSADIVYWIDHRFNQGWRPYQIMHYPFLLNCPPATGVIHRIRKSLLKRIGVSAIDENLVRVCATTAFINSYFLHFAGSAGEMHLVDQNIKSWSEIPRSIGFRHSIPRRVLRQTGRRIFTRVSATVRILRNTMFWIVGRPDLKRWSSERGLEEWWDERTKEIAALIPTGSRVIEFGAGRRRLETFLPTGCSYTPSDLVDRGEGMLVCDLNQRPLPDLSGIAPEVGVFGGVLEYLRDVPALAQWLATEGVNTCVASFDPVPPGLGIMRRHRELGRRRYYGYMNNLTEEDLLRSFGSAGFACTHRQTWTSQVILVFCHSVSNGQLPVS